MPDVLSALIWVPIVCKGYQQTTLVSKVRELTRNSESAIYSINYLPAKAISLINFVNSRSQVQTKNVGHYLDPFCLITYLYS